MSVNIPFVSIGMPVFNDKLFIAKSLDSILAQTHTNFELIISDDGSFDGSEQICLEYASKDKRIKYIRQPNNIGVSRNMQYLLSEGKGQYFMWAGNDDILDPQFIEKLLELLESDPTAVSAFCPTVLIDEDDNHLEIIYSDYSGKDAFERLSKLIDKFEDSCGYGLFRTAEIRNVYFPVWWSINKKRAYNNIYPTICYYLSKGQYSFFKGAPLFYKRIKMKHVNHRVPFTSSFVKGLLAFFLWKFNMVYVSLNQIFRASKSSLLVIRVMPKIFWKWFILPSINMVGKRYSAYKNGQMKFW